MTKKTIIRIVLTGLLIGFIILGLFRSKTAALSIGLPLLFGTVSGRCKKFQTLDLYLASFLSLRGHAPAFTRQGTRVVFEFPASDEVYRVAAEYNGNPDVSLLDFISEIRKNRSQMLAGRG